jgi:hypothetical protein
MLAKELIEQSSEILAGEEEAQFVESLDQHFIDGFSRKRNAGVVRGRIENSKQLSSKSNSASLDNRRSSGSPPYGFLRNPS